MSPSNALSACGLGLLLSACARVPTDDAHAAARDTNLLVITLDTTRADHLGCYGSNSARTPTLDRLAREGVVFERALAAAPITLPSHATLFSGLDPLLHGARDNGLFTVGPETTLLAERMREAGRTTAAFVSALPLARQFGLAQGFDLYDEPSPKDHGGRERSADATVDAALAWWAQKPAGPWFAWLHFFDAHSPYAPPADLAASFAHPYDAEIAHVDRELGRLLAAIGQPTLSRTLIVVTADHGEGLGEHGENEHGIFLYDSTVRVPLIVRMPGSIAAGRRVGGQVGLVDVMPTLLEFFGLDAPEGLCGSSLVASLVGEELAPWHDLRLESLLPWYDHGCAPLEGVATREWKRIEAPRPELYAWPRDAGERDDRIHAEPAVAEHLRARMVELRRGRDPAPPSAVASLAPEDRAQLEELGYVADRDSPDAALDPKDALIIIQARREATAAMKRGDRQRAEAILRETVRRAPREAASLGLLGRLLVTTGRSEEGIALLRRTIELRPDYVAASLDLARALRRTGQPEPALDALEVAVRAAPGLPDAYTEAVQICLASGQIGRAREFLDLARRNVHDPEWVKSLAAAF